MTFDRRCHELACHFLSDFDMARPRHKREALEHEMAAEIQRVIELLLISYKRDKKIVEKSRD